MSCCIRNILALHFYKRLKSINNIIIIINFIEKVFASKKNNVCCMCVQHLKDLFCS